MVARRLSSKEGSNVPEIVPIMETRTVFKKIFAEQSFFEPIRFKEHLSYRPGIIILIGMVLIDSFNTARIFFVASSETLLHQRVHFPDGKFFRISHLFFQFFPSQISGIFEPTNRLFHDEFLSFVLRLF